MAVFPRVTVCLLALMPARAVLAHQPTLSDGSAVDAQHAIQIADVQVSRVVYHEVTTAAPQVWLTFEVSEPQALKLQLGVPYLTRLEGYRPTLAILGPEWPAVAALPAAPEGFGGLVYSSQAVSDPIVFDEPFSGTRSWILVETTAELPAAGRYYVVGYSPNAEAGKLWIALGEKEQFDAGAIASLATDLAAVRRFHEVSSGVASPCLLFPLALAAAGFCFSRARGLRMLIAAAAIARGPSVNEVGQARHIP